MRSARRKLVLWLASAVLVAIVGVAIFGREQILERWYIYRLESDDAATVDHAATRLAEMGSARAIVPLIEQVPREVEKGRRIRHLISYGGGIPLESLDSMLVQKKSYETDSAVLKALSDLGAPAREAAGRELKKDREEFRVPAGSEKANLRDLVDAMQDGRSLRYFKDLPVIQPTRWSTTTY